MAILNGLNATTHQNLQLDAGVLLTNLSENDLDTTFNWDEIASKGLVGATKGGATFTATPELRNLLEDINGSRGAYKTGQVIDNWDVTLKTTVSEVTANNLKLAMNLGELGESKAHHTKYKASVGMIKGKQYNNDIVWAGKIAGKEKPIVILLKNVLNTNGVNFVAADKDSGGIEVELKAHFDLSKPNDVPFYIYLPNS